MDLTVDIRELTDFSTAMSWAGDQLSVEMAASTSVALHEGIGYAQDEVPVDEGNLKADIRILDGPTPGGGAYGSDLVYAWQREEGGTIYPRNARKLVFEIDGVLIFADKVEQEGSHFMEKSRQRLALRIKSIYQLAVDRTLGKI